MPEFLKDFIIAYSTELFVLLLIAGAVGVWVMARALLRSVRREKAARDRAGDGAADAIAPLEDALLEAHRRLDQLEEMVRFDRELGSANRPPR